ncbi:hypothetical protein M8C21_026745 [Ambrosia artemisiifolia]|uniref:Uncharacterized protein n=1 Tax=Ambrosia artemisiifolia TaxID=4212 RepID=A0AAD5GEN4_AMBAR|nr:hypothetical protein M8C21_026745 [Ambrosia artemisiifolia]
MKYRDDGRLFVTRRSIYEIQRGFRLLFKYHFDDGHGVIELSKGEKNHFQISRKLQTNWVYGLQIRIIPSPDN